MANITGVKCQKEKLEYIESDYDGIHGYVVVKSQGVLTRIPETCICELHPNIITDSEVRGMFDYNGMLYRFYKYLVYKPSKGTCLRIEIE